MSTISHNPKIEILPEHIIDQIKAGEVLERPASLVKELIENSIDAGSDKIDIHLIENGLDLLSIEDNGHGMSFQNLPFAFLRHATSKLKTYEDLFHLHSFGFRGEALASIAATSRVTCTTQPTDSALEGGKLIINGGIQELLIPYRQSQKGTSLYIKDLFYNTPARLKFIKSKVSEKSSLKKILNAFILSNPEISFSIKWDDKEKEIYKSIVINHEIDRIKQVFQSTVLSANESHEGYKVEIYFSPTTHTTPQYRHHYLFANNRFFHDKSFHQAILRNLDSIWRYGESGHYMVKITIPTEEMDVNVHPNKTQIKFQKSDIIFSLLVTAIRKALKGIQSASNPSAQSEIQSPQENFFTREENQTFDLQSFGQYSNPVEITAPIKFEEINSFEMSVVGNISKKILLLAKDKKFYIADLSKIYAAYLKLAIGNFIQKDESPGPLLISEPFQVKKGKIDSHFEDLKNLGFEFDRLNPEVIALRTLPKYIHQSAARDTATILIYYFSHPKTQDFNANKFEEFASTNDTVNFNSQFFKLVISEIEKNYPEYFTCLTEENLGFLIK